VPQPDAPQELVPIIRLLSNTGTPRHRRPGHALPRPRGPAHGLHRLLGLAVHAGPPYERVAYVDGLESPTENFHNIAACLVRDGYSDEDIAKVLGANTLRALQQIWV
jgi:microsomal dipeptidase-like Zn-dependent dipeptidase